MKRQPARWDEADLRWGAEMATVGRNASGEAARITGQTRNATGEAEGISKAVGRLAAGDAGGGAHDAGTPQMTWQLRRAELSGISKVRRALRELLRQWGGSPEQEHIAELLVSELVTNALVHTDGGAVVLARLPRGGRATVGGRLRVEVRDFAQRLPQPRRDATHTGTSGRGLVLVETLADAWGVREHGVGKVVWFELEASGPD